MIPRTQDALLTTIQQRLGRMERRVLKSLNLEAELDSGTFDTRFYTQEQIDALFKASRQLPGILPSSVVIAGAGSSASVDEFGNITFALCTSISLNDIFDGLGLDQYKIFFAATTSVDLRNIMARFRASNADLSAASSYGAFYYGIVSAAASNGGTAGATLTEMYFGYGRTTHQAFAEITINKPRATTIKMLLNRTYTYNYIDYSMSNFTSSATSYTGLTIYPATSGTFSGMMKVVKI